MTMYKHSCSCGESWFSDNKEEFDCEYNDDEEDGADHIIKSTNRLTSLDYVELWEDNLESANYLDFADMPAQILAVLSATVKDTKIIKKIMKQLYETIGVP